MDRMAGAACTVRTTNRPSVTAVRTFNAWLAGLDNPACLGRGGSDLSHGRRHRMHSGWVHLHGRLGPGSTTLGPRHSSLVRACERCGLRVGSGVLLPSFLACACRTACMAEQKAVGGQSSTYFSDVEHETSDSVSSDERQTSSERFHDHPPKPCSG